MRKGVFLFDIFHPGESGKYFGLRGPWVPHNECGFPSWTRCRGDCDPTQVRVETVGTCPVVPSVHRLALSGVPHPVVSTNRYPKRPETEVPLRFVPTRTPHLELEPAEDVG